MSPDCSNRKSPARGATDKSGKQNKSRHFELNQNFWDDRVKFAEKVLSLVAQHEETPNPAPFVIVSVTNIRELPRKELINWAKEYKALLEGAFSKFDLPKIISKLKIEGFTGNQAILQHAYLKHGIVMRSSINQDLQIDPFYLLAEQLALQTEETLGALVLKDKKNFEIALQYLKDLQTAKKREKSLLE